MALIGGAVIELSHRNIFLTMLGWVVGTAVAYAFGTVWFVYLMKCSVTYALKYVYIHLSDLILLR